MFNSVLDAMTSMALLSPWDAAPFTFGLALISPAPVPQMKPIARRKTAQFLSERFIAACGSLRYKLFVPAAYDSAGAPLPLLVMLHGYGQDVDDFARGTGTNALAEKIRLPARLPRASVRRLRHQVLELVRTSPPPPRPGRTGADRRRCQQDHVRVCGRRPLRRTLRRPLLHYNCQAAGSVPIIVFHGDLDSTVHPNNGRHVVEQTIRTNTVASYCSALREIGEAAGCSFTPDIHRSKSGEIVAERWTAHGAGHAWSGGSRRGSHTDASGPDASKEMLRFFIRSASA